MSRDPNENTECGEETVPSTMTPLQADNKAVVAVEPKSELSDDQISSVTGGGGSGDFSGGGGGNPQDPRNWAG
jgi:hypothetical protein